MAARLAGRRNVLPAVAGALAASALFAPRAAFGEAPERAGQLPVRKPIYDDPTPPPNTNSSTKTPPSAKLPEQVGSSTIGDPDHGPTPTDRLAVHVKSARLGLYNLSLKAEDGLNRAMTRFFHAERNFTSTIASLAPPPSANEALMPGFTYIFVAMMAGSIITRNRGILLRFAVPVILGLGTAEAVIPVTMRNTGDLIWTWEEKYPSVAQTHLQIRQRVSELWETGKAHSAMTVDMAEQKVGAAKKGVEDWVKKGK